MNEDFQEFFALLNRHGVEFLVIGGVAYNYHAPPRATKDIDLWVEPSRANLERLLLALAELGLDVTEVDPDALSQSARVLMIGRAPNRIDVLTRPDGLVWDEAWRRRLTIDYGTAPIGILSIADLGQACRRASPRLGGRGDAREDRGQAAAKAMKYA